MTLKKYKFSTGVHFSNSSYLGKGEYFDGNGVRQIPFECEEVPESAVFKFACNDPNLYPEAGYIVREIFNSNLLSKYAYFSN